MKKVKLTVLFCFAVLLISSLAGANVTMTNDRTSFEALGTINYNYGFDDFSTDSTYLSWGYVLPGNPWTSHGVTYTSLDNLIGWGGNFYTSIYLTNGTPMMMNNDPNWDPVTGLIDQAGNYSLLGFDAGYGYQIDNGTVITISTNLNNYTFNVTLNPANNTLFYGFVTNSGEYFTGFNINTNDNWALASIDNITLGDNNGQQSVPEPATMFLLGLGLIGVAGIRRKLKG